MRYEYEVLVKSRANGVGKRQMFQTEVVPNQVLSGKALCTRLAEHAGLKVSMAQIYVDTLEGFILEEIAKGNRLDFGLVSFYPRLSASLSARDADPISEDVYVRGAVKARKELMEAPKKNVRPINKLSNDLPRLSSVYDTVLEKGDVIGFEHVLKAYGVNIPIDVSREDEGIWLETRRRGRVATAEITSSERNVATLIFHGAITPGGYTLVLGTRCGKGSDFRVRRCLCKVQVV